MSLRIVITLFISSLFISCNVIDLEPSVDEPVPSPVGTPSSRINFIMTLTDNASRQWETLSFELEGFKGVQNCRLDDLFSFFEDGTYRYDGGFTLCGGDDNQRIKTGVWEIDFDNLQIIFDKDTSLETLATITGLENNRMELSGQVVVFGQSLDIKGIYEYNN